MPLKGFCLTSPNCQEYHHIQTNRKQYDNKAKLTDITERLCIFVEYKFIY